MHWKLSSCSTAFVEEEEEEEEEDEILRFLLPLFLGEWFSSSPVRSDSDSEGWVVVGVTFWEGAAMGELVILATEESL